MHADIAPEISFDAVILLKHRPYPDHLLISEVLHPFVRIDLRLAEDLLRQGSADTEDARQPDLDPLALG